MDKTKKNTVIFSDSFDSTSRGEFVACTQKLASREKGFLPRNWKRIDTRFPEDGQISEWKASAYLIPEEGGYLEQCGRSSWPGTYVLADPVLPERFVLEFDFYRQKDDGMLAVFGCGEDGEGGIRIECTTGDALEQDHVHKHDDREYPHTIVRAGAVRIPLGELKIDEWIEAMALIKDAAAMRRWQRYAYRFDGEWMTVAVRGEEVLRYRFPINPAGKRFGIGDHINRGGRYGNIVLYSTD
jgi:hypothetical protein